MKPFIYALVDPIDPKHVRYVGMATTLHRPRVHAREARNTTTLNHRLNWIRKLQSEGRIYQVMILEELREETSLDFLGFVESCYIKSLREIGHKLTNGTDGGDGLRNPTPDVRVKMSNAQRGNKKSLGVVRSEEFKENLRGNQHAAGYVHTPEWKAYMSELMKGRNLGIKRSDITRQRLHDSHLGQIAWNKGKVGISGRPCPVNCECGRHTGSGHHDNHPGKRCEPGCICGRHRRKN